MMSRCAEKLLASSFSSRGLFFSSILTVRLRFAWSDNCLISEKKSPLLEKEVGPWAFLSQVYLFQALQNIYSVSYERNLLQIYNCALAEGGLEALFFWPLPPYAPPVRFGFWHHWNTKHEEVGSWSVHESSDERFYWTHKVFLVSLVHSVLISSWI